MGDKLALDKYSSSACVLFLGQDLRQDLQDLGQDSQDCRILPRTAPARNTLAWISLVRGNYGSEKVPGTWAPHSTLPTGAR
jgi:hypothetical protein